MMSSGGHPLDSSYRILIGRLLLRVTTRTEIQTSVAWAKLNTNWKIIIIIIIIIITARSSLYFMLGTLYKLLPIGPPLPPPHPPPKKKRKKSPLHEWRSSNLRAWFWKIGQIYIGNFQSWGNIPSLSEVHYLSVNWSLHHWPVKGDANTTPSQVVR